MTIQRSRLSKEDLEQVRQQAFHWGEILSCPDGDSHRLFRMFFHLTLPRLIEEIQLAYAEADKWEQWAKETDQFQKLKTNPQPPEDPFFPRPRPHHQRDPLGPPRKRAIV